MNPVLILTHNCLELTKKCVESVRNQDIETTVFIYDNGSTDGTPEWLTNSYLGGWSFENNTGVSHGWNQGLGTIFHGTEIGHCLVLNNDTILPPQFYSSLITMTRRIPEHTAKECLFLSGASVERLEDAKIIPGTNYNIVPHPDFSAFLIMREAWEKVGPFNEDMKHYASDNDWHIRAHRAGVTLWNSSLPFYHERSSTLKHATVKDRREIQLQADADRDVFQSIYGCYPWEPGYAELFEK